MGTGVFPWRDSSCFCASLRRVRRASKSQIRSRLPKTPGRRLAELHLSPAEMPVLSALSLIAHSHRAVALPGQKSNLTWTRLCQGCETCVDDANGKPVPVPICWELDERCEEVACPVGSEVYVAKPAGEDGSRPCCATYACRPSR